MEKMKKTIKRLIAGSEYNIKDLFKRISNLEDKKLLDVGCSKRFPYSGVFFSILQEAGKTSEEIKNQIILIDKKKYDFQVNKLPDSFTQGDVRSLPYKDGEFDIVASGRLLNNFDDFEDVHKTLNETNRVLKPKGFFIGDIPLRELRRGKEIWRLFTDFLLVDPIESRRYENAIKNSGFRFLSKGTGIYVGPYFRGQGVKELYFVAQKI